MLYIYMYDVVGAICREVAIGPAAVSHARLTRGGGGGSESGQLHHVSTPEWNALRL